jgi:SAM-dependent methyltransferase
VRYPIFISPDTYLKTVKGTWGFSFFKQRGEQWVLDRCLAALPDIRLVCDVPCGAGRLFEYWGRKGYRVIGVDLSIPMIRAAGEELLRLNLSGYSLYGDIFSLNDHLQESPDLVACVRFVYYFEKPQRIKLLQTLRAASSHYVLVQYKTMDTFRGRITMRRSTKLGIPSLKQYCSLSEIREELNEAGLSIIRLIPISQFSDRVFIVAKKTF